MDSRAVVSVARLLFNVNKEGADWIERCTTIEVVGVGQRMPEEDTLG